jgi:hypothetical protein
VLLARARVVVVVVVRGVAVERVERGRRVGGGGGGRLADGERRVRASGGRWRLAVPRRAILTPRRTTNARS